MGRRPTSSTKGGRRMNPADMQRKMDRKKELKRNKKQRTAIRHAVLKSKDPHELIEQMQKLDQMAYDCDCPPPLADRVIDDKRAKLRATFDRVLAMYKRDDEADKADALRKAIRQYDIQRQQMEQNYLAVKFANESKPEEIPLPGGDAVPGAALTPATATGANANAIDTHHIPFPQHMLLPECAPPPAGGRTHGILKKRAGAGGVSEREQRPPGPPAGLPPDLSDMYVEVDSDEASDDGDAAEGKGRVRFAGVQQADDEKDSRTMYKKLAKKIATGAQDDDADADVDGVPSAVSVPPPQQNLAPPPPAPVFTGAQQQPVVFPGQRFTRPPPPPRGMPPPPMPMGMRPPMPPHLMHHLPPGAIGAAIRMHAPPPTNAAVISAAPAIHKRTMCSVPPPQSAASASAGAAAAAGGVTISGAPQMRNMRREAAALVPTAVRVRREAASGGRQQHGRLQQHGATAGGTFAQQHGGGANAHTRPNGKQKATSGDAYDLFMSEINGLL